MSTLTVTNPADGVTMLDIRNDRVSVSDGDGGLILLNAAAPEWGYKILLQNHVMFVNSQQGPAWISAETMTDSVVAVFKPNQARIKVTTSTKVQGDPGGIAETQAVYQVNGGSPVLIPASVFNSNVHADVLNSWEYVWPDDYWDDTVTLHFQTRIQPGAGGFHRSTHGPVRLYGAPQ
jgi:hypothetical protein